MPACARSPPRRHARNRSTAAPGAPRPARPRAVSRGARPRRRRPAPCSSARSCVWLREHLPGDAIVTNGAGNYCVWVNGYYQYRRLPHAARPDQRLDGLRHAGGDRRQARPPRAHRGRVRRRRLPPDDRPGARDRRAVRPAHHLVRGQQRHVRHDPHAPGARLSRPRGRHRTEEPGLRRAGARLRRPRRGGRAHRRLRRRLPPRRAGRRPSRCSTCGSTRRR